MIQRLIQLLVLLSLLLTGCDAADELNVSNTQQQLTPEEQRTLRFELVNDWHVWSGQGTLQNDTLHSEGALSLKVTPTGTSNGFVGVRNLTPLTKDQQRFPSAGGSTGIFCGRLAAPSSAIRAEQASSTDR